MGATPSPLASQIDEARQNGYGDDEIVSYLSSSHPELGPKIQEAQKNGYAAPDIVGYLHDSPTGNQGPTAGSANRFVAGAVSTMNPASLVDAYRQPDASGAPQGVSGILKSTASASADQLSKAKQAAQGAGEFQGYSPLERASEVVGHTLGAIPVLGTAAANVGDELGTQLGNQKQGLPSDVATPAGKAFGLAAGPAIASSTAQLLGKAIVNSGAADAASGALRNSAAGSYSKILAPTTRANKVITQRIAPELADRGVKVLSQKGLQSQAAENLQAVGQQISDAYDQLPPDASVGLDDVVKRLHGAANNALTVVNPSTGEVVPIGPMAQQGLDHVDALTETLKSVAQPDPATGQLVIPIGTVRRVRQYFDKIAAASGRYSGSELADASQAEAHGMAADAIREELAQQYPDVNKLNQEYTFWKNVHKVTTDTLNRKIGQSTPLGQQLATATGAGAGFVKGGPSGAAIGAEGARALTQLFRSPVWNSIAGSTKAALADMIASGSTKGIGAFARQALQRPELYRIGESPALIGDNAQPQRQ